MVLHQIRYEMIPDMILQNCITSGISIKMVNSIVLKPDTAQIGYNMYRLVSPMSNTRWFFLAASKQDLSGPSNVGYWHSHSAIDWKPNHWSIFFCPRHLFSKDNSLVCSRSSQHSHYPKLLIQVEVADDADYFHALSPTSSFSFPLSFFFLSLTLLF